MYMILYVLLYYIHISYIYIYKYMLCTVIDICINIEQIHGKYSRYERGGRGGRDEERK